MRSAALLVVLAACGANGTSYDDAPATVGDVALAVPTQWIASELGANSRVWVPADNVRKESLTVLVGPPLLGDPARALAATKQSFGLLRDGRIVSEQELTTPSGLVGRRFELKFRPSSAIERVYERTHVVIIVDDHPVHIMYTAAQPDSERAVLARVIESIRKAG